MTLIDTGIILILLISIVVSVVRGFFREAVGLVTLVLALLIATLFAPQFGSLFSEQVDSPMARGVVAWIILFAGAYLIGMLIRYLFGKLREGKPLRLFDRMIGGIFGMLRGLLIVSLIVMAAHLDTFSSLRDDQMWHTSRLLPVFVDTSEKIHTLLPERERGYFDYGV